MQQVGQADPLEKLGAHPVGDAVDDLGAVLGGIDMDAEWSFAFHTTPPFARSV